MNGGQFQKGHKINVGNKYRLGAKLSEAAKEKIRTARSKQIIDPLIYKINGLKNREAKHFAWKGDKAGYRALHSWVSVRLGTPQKCEFCGLNGLPADKKRYFQWANRSRAYKRDLTDWIRLCVPCHLTYDKKN